MEWIIVRMKLEKVLLINNELRFQKHVGIYLEMHNYKVCTAYNGYDGLRKAHVEQPDVILLDRTTPQVDGMTLINILKHHESTNHIPLILTTTEEHSESTMKDTGADGFLVKPFKLRDLEKSIHRVLEDRKQTIDHE